MPIRLLRRLPYCITLALVRIVFFMGVTQADLAFCMDLATGSRQAVRGLGMEEVVCKFSRRAHAAGRVGSRLPDRAAACLLASRQA